MLLLGRASVEQGIELVSKEEGRRGAIDISRPVVLAAQALPIATLVLATAVLVILDCFILDQLAVLSVGHAALCETFFLTLLDLEVTE